MPIPLCLYVCTFMYVGICIDLFPSYKFYLTFFLYSPSKNVLYNILALAKSNYNSFRKGLCSLSRNSIGFPMLLI